MSGHGPGVPDTIRRLVPIAHRRARRPARRAPAPARLATLRDRVNTEATRGGRRADDSFIHLLSTAPTGPPPATIVRDHGLSTGCPHLRAHRGGVLGGSDPGVVPRASPGPVGALARRGPSVRDRHGRETASAPPAGPVSPGLSVGPARTCVRRTCSRRARVRGEGGDRRGGTGRSGDVRTGSGPTEGCAHRVRPAAPQDLTAEQSVLGGDAAAARTPSPTSSRCCGPTTSTARPPDGLRLRSSTSTAAASPPTPSPSPPSSQRRGELLRIGGAPYLHTLIATVPTAANAAYYAEIVAEKAILRRLVEAGTRIVQLGYHGSEGADVDDVVDRAQAAIYEVTDRRTTEDYVALEELLQPTMDEIDAIASRGGVSARRAHRLHRPRRRHQRPARGPDDRRRGPSRVGQVHAGTGLRALLLASSTASPARSSPWR